MRLMAQTPLVPAPTSLGSNFESSGGGRKHTTSPRSGLLSLMDTLSRMKRSPTLNVGCMDSDGMCLASATYSRSAYAPPNMDPSSSVAPAARRPREVVHRGERGVIATLVASKTAIISFSDSDASPLFTHTRAWIRPHKSLCDLLPAIWSFPPLPSTCAPGRVRRVPKSVPTLRWVLRRAHTCIYVPVKQKQ